MDLLYTYKYIDRPIYYTNSPQFSIFKNPTLHSYLYNKHITFNELSQKNRFKSVRIAALCLFNIQRENLDFKKSLSTIQIVKFSFCFLSKTDYSAEIGIIIHRGKTFLFFFWKQSKDLKFGSNIRNHVAPKNIWAANVWCARLSLLYARLLY